MISLTNPVEWLDADLQELHHFASSVESALDATMRNADRLQALGAKSVPDNLRNAEFDHQAFGDLKAVLTSRIKSEKPNPDDILGKLPEHSKAPGFEKLVNDRVKFLQQNGYSIEEITATQKRLIEDKD